MRPVSLLLLVVSTFTAVGSVHVDLPSPYKDDCVVARGENLYKPAAALSVPWFNVSLDDKPEDMWKEVALAYKDHVKDLIQALKDFILPIWPGALDFVDKYMPVLLLKLKNPYRQEIQGIADNTGLPVGEIILYNIFYEIFTVCTSIIGQDPMGNVYHARNLDFGLFLGWDADVHEWSVSQQLRKMVINVNWHKDGKLLFKTNNFAGFIGVYNGLKPGIFTVTANERFLLQGGFVGIYRWLVQGEDLEWMTWLTRDALINAKSYDEAVHILGTTPMMSPVYYIVGGPEPWQGTVMARSLNQTDLKNDLDPNDPVKGWYLLETNYDLNQAPLYLDDRNTPGNKCMQTLRQENVGFEGIYNVLSSKTNLNKLTTYTVLMNVNTGEFETHMQSCPGDCWPF